MHGAIRPPRLGDCETRHATLHDACFLACYVGKCWAQYLHMVVVQSGDASHRRLRNDIRGIQAASQPDLKNDDVHSLLRKDVKAQQSKEVEEARLVHTLVPRLRNERYQASEAPG